MLTPLHEKCVVLFGQLWQSMPIGVCSPCFLMPLSRACLKRCCRPDVHLTTEVVADQPAARRRLALHLLELLGAPLGAWRCSNAAAGDADAAESLGPELAAALAAVGGDPASPNPDPGCPDEGAARAPRGSAAWLSPDGFYACSAADALAGGAGGADAAASGAPPAAAAPSAATPRSQPLQPAPAWFQARPRFTPCHSARQYRHALELLLDALVRTLPALGLLLIDSRD